MHKCSFCDFSYKHLQGLQKHIRLKHPDMTTRRNKKTKQTKNPYDSFWSGEEEVISDFEEEDELIPIYQTKVDKVLIEYVEMMLKQDIPNVEEVVKNFVLSHKSINGREGEIKIYYQDYLNEVVKDKKKAELNITELSKKPRKLINKSFSICNEDELNECINALTYEKAKAKFCLKFGNETIPKHVGVRFINKCLQNFINHVTNNINMEINNINVLEINAPSHEFKDAIYYNNNFNMEVNNA